MAIIAIQVCGVAVRKVNFKEIKLFYNEKSQKNFYIFLFIAFLSVFKEPISGIVFGMLVYLIAFSEELTSCWYDILILDGNGTDKLIGFELEKPMDAIEGKYEIYRFIGMINFMNIDKHYEKIKNICKNPNEKGVLILSFIYVYFVDQEAVHCLEELIKDINSNKKDFNRDKVYFTGFSGSKMEIFKNDHEFFLKLKESGLLSGPAALGTNSK